MEKHSWVAHPHTHTHSSVGKIRRLRWTEPRARARSPLKSNIGWGDQDDSTGTATLWAAVIR
eukprot:8953627-Alexandrium_andersonii.AAC.1